MNTTGNTARWKTISLALLACSIVAAAAAVYKNGNSDAATAAGNETQTVREQKHTSAISADTPYDPLAKVRESMRKGIEERKQHPEKYGIDVSEKSLVEALSESYGSQGSPDRKQQ